MENNSMQTSGPSLEKAKENVDQDMWVIKSYQETENGVLVVWSKRQN